MLPSRPLVAAALIACWLFAPTASAYKRFCASDDSLRFGNRAIGSTTTATVTISSCGDESWTFTDVQLHAATGTAFRVASSCATGMTLGPGKSCEVDVTFAPLLPGQTSGALWLRQTSTTHDQLLTFYGRGVAPNVGIDAKQGTVVAIEFFHAARNHYFLTTEPAEAAMIDAGGVGPGWVRTGNGFRVWPMTASADADAVDVCRFFGASGAGPDAHFFTGDARECAALRNDAVWRFEGLAFRSHAPAFGRCVAGFDPVVRLYWNGNVGTEMRHRYVVDAAVVQAMAGAGWIVEGAVLCSPR